MDRSAAPEYDGINGSDSPFEEDDSNTAIHLQSLLSKTQRTNNNNDAMNRNSNNDEEDHPKYPLGEEGDDGRILKKRYTNDSQQQQHQHNKYQEEFVLHRFEELPLFLQDNQFITSGYRANFSVALCIKSLFRRHNDLLAGFLLFFLSIATLNVFLQQPYTIQSPSPTSADPATSPIQYQHHSIPSATDKFVFLVFLLFATLHMWFSSTFHTFACHSPKAFKWLAKLDYVGISLMIVGSYYPPLYYGFACQRTWQIVYMILISLFGVVGLIVSSFDIFATPRFRPVRVGFFLVFGFFAVFPVPHFTIINGWEWTWPILWRELIMGVLYVIGAFIYGTRCPERITHKYKPGLCDIVCSVVFILLSSIAHSS